jgi:uncharacterized membrane protein YqjE
VADKQADATQADDQRQPAGLAVEIRRMLELRGRLARLELAEARRAVRHLLYLLVPAVAMLLAAMPLLAVALAEQMAGLGGIAKIGWLAILAGALALAGAAVAWWAWRHFRREFKGLEQSLEELREDLAWIQERFSGRAEE